MIKLRISYKEEHELKDFLKLLPAKVVMAVKIPKKQQGTYKRAYAEVSTRLTNKE